MSVAAIISSPFTNLSKPILGVGSSSTSGFQSIQLIITIAIITLGGFGFLDSGVTANNFYVSKGNSEFTREINEFVGISEGKQWDDGGGGGYLGQCVSLSKRWMRFIGATVEPWFVTPTNAGYGFPIPSYVTWRDKGVGFTKPNKKFTPIAIDKIEDISAGDVIVLLSTKKTPGPFPANNVSGLGNPNNSFSHTGIAVSGYNGGEEYSIIDQNWDGSLIPKGPARVSKYNKHTFFGAVRFVKNK